VALLQAGAVLFEGLGLDGDEATGANIVKVAPEAWLKQIAVDAGLEGGVVAEKVRGLTAGGGLDAATGTLYIRTMQSSRAGRPPACHLAGSGCDQEGCVGHPTCLGS
jgi:chaperonin GroEL (HSP60 family)